MFIKIRSTFLLKQKTSGRFLQGSYGEYRFEKQANDQHNEARDKCEDPEKEAKPCQAFLCICSRHSHDKPQKRRARADAVKPYAELELRNARGVNA